MNKRLPHNGYHACIRIRKADRRWAGSEGSSAVKDPSSLPVQCPTQTCGADVYGGAFNVSAVRSLSSLPRNARSLTDHLLIHSWTVHNVPRALASAVTHSACLARAWQLPRNPCHIFWHRQGGKGRGGGPEFRDQFGH